MKKGHILTSKNLNQRMPNNALLKKL